MTNRFSHLPSPPTPVPITGRRVALATRRQSPRRVVARVCASGFALLVCLLWLMAISGCQSSSVDQLRAQLHDADPDTQYEAAKALESMGANAGPAAEDLATLLSHDDPRLRYRAAKALSKIGIAAAPAAEALTMCVIDDDDPEVRYYAAKTLDQIPRAAGERVDLLIQALDDPDPKVRYYIVKTLGKVGENAAAALPKLESLKRDGDQSVRKAAENAIRRINKRRNNS